MKATTAIGFALIGVALLLLGMNFVVPNWIAQNPSIAQKIGPSASLGSVTRFAESPDDAVANGETPGTAMVVHRPYRVKHRVHHAKLKKIAKHTTNAPLPAPSYLQATAADSSPIVNTSTTEASPQVMITVHDGEVTSSHSSYATALPVEATAGAVMLSNTDLARIRKLREDAQRDMVRRAAIASAMNSARGTHVRSTDIDDEGNGHYRVLVIEQQPRGTVVESMSFIASGSGLVAKRHILSSQLSPLPATPAPSPSGTPLVQKKR
jgi:hypothetical protein